MEVKPGYKQTEVGIIPEGWTCEPLSEFFSFISYGFTNPMPTVHDGVFMITAADINDGRLQLETARKTSEAAYRTLLTAKSKPRPNDILLTKDGTLGRLALVGNERVCINQSVAVIRPNARVEPQFLKLLLESPRYQKQMVEDAGGSTIKHIYITIVDKMALGLPLDKAEQRAIATALSDVDGLLGGLDRLIVKKRDLKQAAMQQLLTGQTRLPGFHGKWKNTTLGQIISRFSTGLNPRQNFRLNAGGNLFYVTIKNFAQGRLLLDEECDLIDEDAFRRINERSDLRKDDILFASIGRIGDAYLITETPRNWNINESVFTLRPDKEQVVPLMLFYLLTNKSVKDALGQGITGSTFKSIKQAELKAIPCLMPVSHDEQTAIAEVLTEMDAELAALEQRREKTRALKQAMMQELLTGRTRLV